MSPEDYILRKKDEFPPIALPTAYDLQALAKKINLSRDEENALNNADFPKDYLHFLFQTNRFRIPQPILDLFDDKKLALGEINNPIPNAHYKKLNEDGHAITFNVGLRLFIYRVIRAYSTRFATKDDEEIHISFEETCQKISDIFWWYLASDGITAGPDYPITTNQIILASKLTSECEFFFLAHEIGHLIIEITNAGANKLTEREEECAADFYALHICLGGERHTNKNSIELIYAGIEISFLVFDALEKLGHDVEDHVHPKALDRISYFRQTLQEKSPSDYLKIREMSDINEMLFAKIISIISGEDSTHKDFFDQKAELLRNDINTLLHTCSCQLIPDYTTFNKKMSELFDIGYHHILFEIIEDFSKRIQLEHDTDTLIKYKLLVNFSLTLAQPLKQVFRQKLGLK